MKKPVLHEYDGQLQLYKFFFVYLILNNTFASWLGGATQLP